MATTTALAAYKAGQKAGKRKTRRKSKTLPLAIVAGMIPLASYAVACYKSNPADPLHALGVGTVSALTGYHYDEGVWRPASMRYGTLPIVAGFLVHKLASRFGVNAALGRAGVPFVRI